MVRAQSLPRVRGRHGGTMAAVRHPEAAARERHGTAFARTAGVRLAADPPPSRSAVPSALRVCVETD